MRVKLKKNEGNEVEKGFKHSSPDFYCSWDVLVFSKITVLPLHSPI